MDTDAWQGPPIDVLGRGVPIEQFIARSDRAVLALQQVLAFPQGCLLTLQLAVRRGPLDAAAWQRMVDGVDGTDPGGAVGLKFGVRFPDGSRATTVQNPFAGWASRTDQPQRPMLVDIGGGSTGTDRMYRGDRQLWLWPLPQPGLVEFVVEWREVGIERTSATLDGEAMARASRLAMPYWS